MFFKIESGSKYFVPKGITYSSKVELVNFEWNRYNNQFQSFIEMEEYEAENPRIKQYKEKFEKLAGFLKQKLGTPHKVLVEIYESEMEWQE